MCVDEPRITWAPNFCTSRAGPVPSMDGLTRKPTLSPAARRSSRARAPNSMCWCQYTGISDFRSRTACSAVALPATCVTRQVAQIACTAPQAMTTATRYSSSRPRVSLRLPRVTLRYSVFLSCGIRRTTARRRPQPRRRVPGSFGDCGAAAVRLHPGILPARAAGLNGRSQIFPRSRAWLRAGRTRHRHPPRVPRAA